VPVAAYLEGVRRELQLRFGGKRLDPVETLYLGGGTPSRLGGNGIARLVREVTRVFPLQPEAEVTVEANPEDVTPATVAEWRYAGVNRISLGVQSFDDAVLGWMHRAHDAAAVPRAVETIREAGITNYSVDLIFSLPDSLERDWRSDLREALALRPTHVSLYGLTIERMTPLGRWSERGEVREAPEERYESEFLLANRVLSAAGFEHYEVSSFAQPGCWSRHNAAYWSGAAYVGVGPAAHEFDGERRRRWNVGPYAEWLRLVTEGSDPMDETEELSDDSREAEQIYLGLRTRAGVRLRRDEQALVAPWIASGWARMEGSERLLLTPLGWLRLDSLSQSLTVHRSR
jgi:oxygen-independent coproporphyrinogen III oxidase